MPTAPVHLVLLCTQTLNTQQCFRATDVQQEASHMLNGLGNRVLRGYQPALPYTLGSGLESVLNRRPTL